MFDNILKSYGLESINVKKVHDIKSILKNRIETYFAEFNTCEDSESFSNYQNISEEPTSLAELLQKDLEIVLNNNPKLKSRIPRIKFQEVRGGIPQAQMMMSKKFKNDILITFDQNFLPMIHKAVGITNIMTLSKKNHGVAEKDYSLLMGEGYSDESLYAEYASLIDRCYKKCQNLELNEFDYIYNPCDLTEMIQGIRQFVILHEIGHWHYADTTWVKKEEKEGYKGLEEFLCDLYAIRAIMKCYPKTTDNDQLYEFRNAMKGIQFYLVLLAKIDSYHGLCKADSQHPYSYLRLLNVFVEFINYERFDDLSEKAFQCGLVEDHFATKRFYLFCLLTSPDKIEWSKRLRENEKTKKLYIQHQRNFSEVFKEIETLKSSRDIYINYENGMKELISIFYYLNLGNPSSLLNELRVAKEYAAID